MSANELTKLRRQLAAAQAVIKAQEVRLSNAAQLAEKHREAIATLQSERDANAALTAAVEDLRADAERLDWLEARINADGEIHLHDGAHARGTGLGLRPGTMNRTLREAIDTARGQA